MDIEVGIIRGGLVVRRSLGRGCEKGGTVYERRWKREGWKWKVDGKGRARREADRRRGRRKGGSPERWKSER